MKDPYKYLLLARVLALALIWRKTVQVPVLLAG